MEEEKGRWVTILKRRVFIKENQTLTEALKESKKFSEDLQERLRKQMNLPSKEEEHALYWYIGSDSYIINDCIRKNIPLNEIQKKNIENLDKALDKMPNYKGIVKRSIRVRTNDEKIKSDFLKEYKENETITFPSYTSCTIAKEDYDPDSPIQYRIKSKTAKNISKYNPSEEEVIFKRNTKFKVIEIKEYKDTSGNDKIDIKLEEL